MILIHDGKIDHEALSKMQLTTHELKAALVHQVGDASGMLVAPMEQQNRLAWRKASGRSGGPMTVEKLHPVMGAEARGFQDPSMVHLAGDPMRIAHG